MKNKNHKLKINQDHQKKKLSLWKALEVMNWMWGNLTYILMDCLKIETKHGKTHINITLFSSYSYYWFEYFFVPLYCFVYFAIC
jgi:hypothetical protein